MNLPYNCKFCRKPGFVQGDDHFADMAKMEEWLKIICCNRCGGYMERKRTIQDNIRNQCINLVRSRQSFAPEKRSGLETQTRQTLTVLCDKFSRLVCDHFRIQHVFEDEFVQIIFDKPMNAMAALDRYVRGVREIAK